MRAFWFGCSTPPGPKGHGLNPAQYPYHGPGSYEERRTFPFTQSRLDGAFCPREEGREFPQGQARLTHIGGWTVVAFWDRTGDSRPASNTAFIFDQTLDGARALEAAKEIFPRLFARFTFQIAIVETVEE